MSIDQWILGSGLLAIALTVFAESGLLFGFFLPGDTLLFGAGILASQGVFNLPLLISVIIVAAIVGDNVGYSIGRRTGRRLFSKKESLFFKPERLESAEKFYEKHGGKTIILARFVPVVRTFAPMIAGMSRMTRQQFMFFNVIGAVAWGAGVTLAGYYLGKRLPWLEHYLEPVILIIIGVSLLSGTWHILKDKSTRALLATKIKHFARDVLLNKKVD